MQIYEKVFWTLENSFSNIKEIMGSDMVRKVHKDEEVLSQSGFSFWYEELTEENFQEFTEQVYLPVIWEKQNQTTDKIFSLLTPQEIQKTPRYFIFIRQGKKLYGGGIFRLDKEVNILRFSYKANAKDTLWLKAGFWTLIDVIYFSFGIEHQVKSFSYGTDRNGYGTLGANPSVWLHKLYLWFTPQIHQKNRTMIRICTEDIDVPTLIFTDADKNGKFTSAYLFKNDGSIKEHILEKRWFKIYSIP